MHPGYPSLENKYNFGFIHTRVQAYIEAGMNVDVVACNEMPDNYIYEFENVKVNKLSFYSLRELLRKKKFKRILIHFFDEKYANLLEATDTSETMLYFYLHGAETLYWDWPKLASKYFEPPVEIDDELRKYFEEKDYFIKKYNNVKNAKWIFVTEWTRKRCEELLNIKFNNSDVVPCLIDTNLFSYEEKDPELRKKIFVLRKFDNINSYSLDNVAKIILALSKKDYFKDLQFDIYGDGSMHEKLLEPIKHFENVHIEKRFLTHEEIREVHQTHGIALFPTRFDSQAVSSCEAASSGCAVVTSNIPGVRQFIPEDLGVMCETEDIDSYVNVIEKMYFDKDYFLKVAKEESESVRSKFGYENTIKKDLSIYENEEKIEADFKIEPKETVLSVIIPSYNVEKYLKNTVFSLVDQKNASKIEIIIVNDGSKDSTSEIASEIQNRYGNIIRVINKENGGHGSTINVGIEEAKGKYIKVVDGDDTVDSEEFAKLIDILQDENSDVVLCNYYEDYEKNNELKRITIYKNLEERKQYHFDELCDEKTGFTEWGPILACSCYKAEVLKKAGFKLSEKMFYVDMELNINVAVFFDTVTYYDLFVYRYLLGRPNQSVNKESYKKNYKHHENVTINMINIYEKYKDQLSEEKKNYIINKLVLPMVSTQYYVTIEYHNTSKAFREFNKRLKKYPYFYNNKKVKIRKVRFHRLTNGRLIWLNETLVKIRSLFNRG